MKLNEKQIEFLKELALTNAKVKEIFPELDDRINIYYDSNNKGFYSRETESNVLFLDCNHKQFIINTGEFNWEIKEIVGYSRLTPTRK